MTKVKYAYTLAEFDAWFTKAKPGAQCVYHQSTLERNEELFKASREYFALDGVILYQRHSPVDYDIWEWVAQRCSDRAAAWVARMSASVPAPYNQYAHEASA